MMQATATAVSTAPCISSEETSADKTFPSRLYRFLNITDEYNISHIVSWQPHGRCFRIHKPDDFVRITEPRWFLYKKYSSLQRQLNIYGFLRITKGVDKDCYYHKYFLKGQDDLIHKIIRVPVKNRSTSRPTSPPSTPDFYSMTPLSAVASTSTRSIQEMAANNQFVQVDSLNSRNGRDGARSSKPVTTEMITDITPTTNHLQFNQNSTSMNQSIPNPLIHSPSVTNSVREILLRQLLDYDQDQRLHHAESSQLLPHPNPSNETTLLMDQNRALPTPFAMNLSSASSTGIANNNLCGYDTLSRSAIIAQLQQLSQQQAAVQARNSAISSLVASPNIQSLPINQVQFLNSYALSQLRILNEQQQRIDMRSAFETTPNRVRVQTLLNQPRQIPTSELTVNDMLLLLLRGSDNQTDSSIRGYFSP